MEAGSKNLKAYSPLAGLAWARKETERENRERETGSHTQTALIEWTAKLASHR